MALDRQSTHEALALLGELLEDGGHGMTHLIVTGGSALLAAGVVARATKDVDVLARRGEIDGEVMTAYPLPSYVAEAAAKVARELRLPTNWLNASTSLLMVPVDQLPAQIWSDVLERDYGTSLRVGFVGRGGQIYLKMYAAVGREEERDLEDLRALDPSSSERRAALSWLQDCELIDQGNRDRLETVLTQLGYHDLLD